jgi:hypothetical protein
MAQRFDELKKSGIVSVSNAQRKAFLKHFVKTKRETQKQNPSSLA